MELKALLFAGIAFFFCVAFIAVGAFFYFHYNSEVEHFEGVVDSYENPTGKNHHWYESDYPPLSGQNHTWPDYVNATEELEDAKSGKSTTAIWFVLGIIMLLVAVTLVAIHFILEKRADDKMASSFFMDGEGGGGGKEEEPPS